MLGSFLLTPRNFTKEQLMDILRLVKKAGLNTFCHIVSASDPLICLNDMTVRTHFGEYDISPALMPPDEEGKISYLTQGEMDEVLKLAKELELEYIPTFTIPSHMDKVLALFPHLCYEGTKGSANIKDPEAVEFCYALIEKYADYFASHGFTYFNIGADEFAQELNNEMGYDMIYENGEMKYFVDFMNGIIDRLAKKGVKTIAWNDGICYNNDATTYKEIDKRLIIAYWIPGWGRRVATPKFLEEQGYTVLNSFHTYYVDSNTTDFEERAKAFAKLDIKNVSQQEGFYLEKPLGAQTCCWSIKNAKPQDYIKIMEPLLLAFGEAYQKNLEKYSLK
jgi:hexosaminidase